MGIERKLCCRLWATHCSPLASGWHWQRGARQCAWGSHLQPGWMHQAGRDHADTDGPQGRAGQGTGCVSGQAQFGGSEHSAVLRDGVHLPPPTLLPLKRNRCHDLWAFLFPLHFFQEKKKKDSASARVLIATTSNGLTFFYFLCNKVIQETSQQEFFPFRKSSAGAHGN